MALYVDKCSNYLQRKSFSVVIVPAKVPFRCIELFHYLFSENVYYTCIYTSVAK